MDHYLARSENSRGETEPLTTHLEKTAKLAGIFAGAFGEGRAGEWMGWFHDAGKASALFQDVLHKRAYHVDHSAAGACLLLNVGRDHLIARAIYAHHDGLYWHILSDLQRSYESEDQYDPREGKRYAVSGKAQYAALAAYMHSLPGIPKAQPELRKDAVSGFSGLPEMLHARMLLSCLCDADYTASASHEDPSILDKVEAHPLDASAILRSLEAYRNGIIEASQADPKLNAIRDRVYQSCLAAAELPPGMFTLTAPTGTGKTLALLAFAAKHAALHRKRRIIIVLPFLSIITQNAKIYREICSDILEAHSMASYGDDEDVKLLAERWDAPVIVTTSVKFFETFFRSRPTDLRHLHSIAESVIVFDEAQSIPMGLTGTTMETMRCMCETFGCTMLLSTATQPAFDVRKDVQFHPIEVMQDPAAVYQQTRRVSVVWDVDAPTSLADIADEMAAQQSVCCVLNRKDHTRKLFRMLKERCEEGECFHISTDMCKAHRDVVLEEIRARLHDHLPCRLVSTSCIEAGVDLDFAAMYRALAPLEAIVQCAGRCNRNGKGSGQMTVFVPDEEKLYPSASYQNAAMIVKLVLSRHPIDIQDPAHIREYYTALFTHQSYDHDAPKLVSAIEAHDFVEAERQYRFIPQAGVDVLVPYQGEKALYDDLVSEAQEKGISADWMRRAAPLTVSCYREDKLRDLAEPCMLYSRGRRIPVPGRYLLYDPSFYDAATGLYFTDDSSLGYLV